LKQAPATNTTAAVLISYNLGIINRSQERDLFEQRAQELKSKQERAEELQRSLVAAAREREDHVRLLATKEEVVGSQAAQVVQLSEARDRLQQQVIQLEAALQDVDTRKQMNLLQAQYDQVHVSCSG
jgi:hypothetical protein